MAQMTPIFYLKTLSTPFSYSVGNMQDKKLYRAFVWNLLGSHPDSVNCHCQPLVRDSEDLSLVYWGDYKEALKWLFYKLTRSRVLHDDELQHLGNRLFANNEFSNSKTFSPQRGEPSWPGFSQIRMLQSDQKSSKGKKNKYASLFYWYFEAIDLIIDRQASMKRSRDQPRGPELSMANLFQTGMLLGFISRSESEKLLRASDRNAMLIRFSDHFCGHITVSYIEKKTDGSPDKVEHVRPLTRSLLAGMGLPMMIAVLINLTNVKHIITARLSPGQTTLSDEDYTWKQDLIKNHLDHYEDGIYSQSEGDKYTYASRLMLKVQKTRRDASQAAEAASPLSNMQTSRYSPQTPATDRFDNQLDTLFEQFRNHPRVLQLTEELAQNAKRNDAISPSESSRNSHTEPSSSTTPATTFIQQNPILPSQHPPMPMPFPSAQRQSSFQPTLQMAMQYQPTNPATMPFQSNNGVQMMLPQQQQQQQPMMMQGGQQSQWNVHPQAQHSSANVMQGYNQPQQIQMELQQMTIGSQQQQRTFTSPVNQFPQPQGMMQQSPLSHTGHQQVVGQHASQSQNAQAQIMPQQQMSSSSSYVQQPQQGMMQSSFGYQPQQQYYPQYQSQPGTFMQQPFGGNMQTLQQQQQPQMLPNFQSNAQIPYLRNVDDR
uniref:SH2 domain-containing protein n=1 Tax=Plectus sambesii TaxID=2011161 RepID=A0A914VZJ5_9BILA